MSEQIKKELEEKAENIGTEKTLTPEELAAIVGGEENDK